MEIKFQEAVKIPISLRVQREEREKKLTTKEGYYIVELESFLIPFEGKYSGHFFVKKGGKESWYCFRYKTELDKLKSLVKTSAE